MKKNNLLIKKLINKITVIHTTDDLNHFMVQLTKVNEATVISFMNAHGFNLAVDNMEFYNAIINSNVVLRDGIGMQLLFRKVKQAEGINMNGTDFIPKILMLYQGKRIALFGTKSPNIDFAKQNMEKEGIQVISALNGFFPIQTYIDEISNKKPDIILLGMGMPKQEFTSLKLKEAIDYPCLIINGGAILDFMSGQIKRAPLWVRKLYLEWLYRLLKEPRRLFNRYVFGNLKFIYKIIVYKTQ